MIKLLTLLLSVSGSVHAQAVNWNADPAAHVGARVAAMRKKEKKAPKDESSQISSVDAPDSAKLTPEQLACQPDVIEGFKKIFSQAGNGGFDTEAAFRIDLIGGKRVVLVSPQTHQFKKMEVPLSDQTIAIAHTHPQANYHPSTQDETSPVPNFVVSRSALWVTNPHPAKHEPHSRKVRDNDWMKPCQETK